MTDGQILDWIHVQMMAIPTDFSNVRHDDCVRALARQRTFAEIRDYIHARQMEEAECEKQKFKNQLYCSEEVISGMPCSTQTTGEPGSMLIPSIDWPTKLSE